MAATSATTECTAAALPFVRRHAATTAPRPARAAGQRAGVDPDTWRRTSPPGVAPRERDRDAVYARLQPLVRRLIARYGTTPDLRQELVGELYHRFCTLLEAFDPQRGISLEGYLIRSLTAAAYTYARSQWQRQRREVSFDPEIGEHLAPSADPTPQWDHQILLGSLRKEFRDSISGLPERQRQVLIGRYFLGQSHAEIAARLETCPATARSLLRHAINRLRRDLEAARVQEAVRA